MHLSTITLSGPCPYIVLLIIGNTRRRLETSEKSRIIYDDHILGVGKQCNTYVAAYEDVSLIVVSNKLLFECNDPLKKPMRDSRNIWRKKNVSWGLNHLLINKCVLPIPCVCNFVRRYFKISKVTLHFFQIDYIVNKDLDVTLNLLFP